ncbi:MAG: chromate transporter [Lacunisphaera sp.]|nr:chromate transporter [Lacunisphaera sp.]
MRAPPWLLEMKLTHYPTLRGRHAPRRLTPVGVRAILPGRMRETPRTSEPAALAHPGFKEALRFWLKLGFISFGGPTGQIAIMHTELVEKKRWIGEERFLHALNYCMLLPGPEAQQLAIYCGWLLHRTWGGLTAGILFVLPSAFILWGLSLVYVSYGNVPWISAVFYGLKPAVLAIVAAAVLRIGSKALKNAVMWSLAALAFVAIFFFHASFPAIILAAALLGYGGGLRWEKIFNVVKGHGAKPPADRAAVIDDTHAAPAHTKPSLLRAVRVLAVGLALWWLPVLATALAQGRAGTLVQESLFFSKAAMVTFGGAYAVLPYVAQQAVENFHWLTAPQMLDGLGLAETTPGPLIMVLQFVGFLGGWNHPGALSPLLAATLGAALTTWVTFVPCFIWIFLGAPYLEQLRNQTRLTCALSAVTAAVVGVVLNLAVWFGLHVVLPAGGKADWFVVVVALLAFAALQRFKAGVIPVVLAGAGLGLLKHLVA